ncbi:hypothetical protein GCM10011374_18400 [Kocuria dechangensis]|uniref:Uncharacterized protein n=1 Tax=Kocuria dechangensis TaxID=1176249 RepID=A0A917GSC1_9MICC|nr:hypothetical protein GCM10011374_18400 [Kocuria dechangensis]
MGLGESTIVTVTIGTREDSAEHLVGARAVKRPSSVTRPVSAVPEGLRVHDLQHLSASLLIRASQDTRTVPAGMRHESATTTLDTDACLRPETEESAPAAIAAGADSIRTGGAAATFSS